MKSTKEGKKTVNMDIPVHLYNMLKTIGLKEGLTTTSIFIQYLEYLEAQKGKKKLLNADSEDDFTLRVCCGSVKTK